ncbi:MAG: tripartite tricarboxylate transporter substrate binding protein [Bradyrhizobium sp.]|nr:MAG: tripartite tricarboxylate transporter substrate binding protein [Bradyrhizobium sp.]
MEPNPGSAGWWPSPTCRARPRCRITAPKSLTASLATSIRTMTRTGIAIDQISCNALRRRRRPIEGFRVKRLFCVKRLAQISPSAAGVFLILALLLAGLGEARAAWPERTITIIVPFPAGGPSDLLGRLLAAELAPNLKQNVIVENRTGAVGNIGIAAAARAEPDGYTLLVVTNVVLINPSVSRVSYDPLKDLAPIAYLGAAPNVIITRPASGIASIADLISRARAAPDKLNYASPGVGSVSQLAVELLKLRANIGITHIPFNGATPALQAALAGTTDIGSISIAGLIGFIRSGELKGLAQTGSERWFDLPDVPTMGEAGIPNAVVETTQMFLAPAGTPGPIIARLTEETRVILQNPDIKAKMLNAGFMVKYEGPEDLHSRMVREIPMWKEIVERAGLEKK